MGFLMTTADRLEQMGQMEQMGQRGKAGAVGTEIGGTRPDVGHG